MSSENELVLGIKSGDESAFKAIFDKYYIRLLRFATSYLGDRHIAENVVQESFVLLWENRSQLSDETHSIFAFLVQVVKLKTMNQLEKRRRRLSIDQYIHADALREIDLNIYTMNNLGSANLYLSEIEAIVAATMAQLPEQTRYVFQLSRDQYLSNKAIANHIGKSEKAVEYHLSKALKALRKALADYLRLFLLAFGF